MKTINFFDFDLNLNSIQFNNWVAINLIRKFNPCEKIILWLTKEITVNYYLIDLMSFIEVKVWAEHFPNQDSKDDFSKFLCKLNAIEKYRGFSLNLKVE